MERFQSDHADCSSYTNSSKRQILWSQQIQIEWYIMLSIPPIQVVLERDSWITAFPGCSCWLFLPTELSVQQQQVCGAEPWRLEGVGGAWRYVRPRGGAAEEETGRGVASSVSDPTMSDWEGVEALCKDTFWVCSTRKLLTVFPECEVRAGAARSGAGWSQSSARETGNEKNISWKLFLEVNRMKSATSKCWSAKTKPCCYTPSRQTDRNMVIWYLASGGRGQSPAASRFTCSFGGLSLILWKT